MMRTYKADRNIEQKRFRCISQRNMSDRLIILIILPSHGIETNINIADLNDDVTWLIRGVEADPFRSNTET
jgi:hypothetical protein